MRGYRERKKDVTQPRRVCNTLRVKEKIDIENKVIK